MRRLLRALILSSLAACDGPPACEEDCDELSLAIGTMDAGEYVPHEEGTQFPWSWGFQGGTMIQPLIALDPGEVGEGERVDFVFRHDPDPDYPDAFGQAAEFRTLVTTLFTWRTPAGTIVAGPPLDQLGWTPLDGMRLTLTVEASTTRGRGTLSRVLELAPGPPDTAVCAPFPIVEGSCAVRTFEGEATVTAIEVPEPNELSCTDGRRVELAFALNDTQAATRCLSALGGTPSPTQLLLFTGANPPASCLDAAGVTVGTRVPARYSWVVRGGCAPSFEAEIDLGACECTLSP